MWERIGVSLGVLLISFLLQKFLSFTSRNRLAGSRWGREDYLMWPDWLASGMIALFAFLIKGNGGMSIGPTQLYALAFIVMINMTLPVIVRELSYDSASPHTLLTWQGIVTPNVVAAITVGVAVGVGVDFSN